VNVALVLVWLAATTPLTFADLGGDLVRRTLSAYGGVFRFSVDAVRWLINKF